MLIDGTATTPGCKCGPECEFPCWQRVGIAPPCKGCGCDADEIKMNNSMEEQQQ